MTGVYFAQHGQHRISVLSGFEHVLPSSRQVRRTYLELLCISPHAVRDHLKVISDKLGVHSRRELVDGLVTVREN